jgi:hypothetical protein
VLFAAFLVFDLNRVARAGQVSQGDTILMAVSVLSATRFDRVAG